MIHKAIVHSKITKAIHPYQNGIILFLFLSSMMAFYWFQDLYWVDNHNDFGEHFTRAERWSVGELTWTGGSEKLLSAIEMVPIYFFPYDFVKIYWTINLIIFLLLFGAVYLFLVSKAPFLPRTFDRYALCTIFLLHPFFLLKARTVDPSLILTIMLLFFISIHHIPWLATLFAFLTFISRPEGLIIFPLYLFLCIVNKTERSRTILGFVVFILLTLIYKLAESYIFQGIHQEYSIATTSLNQSIYNQAMQIIFLPFRPILLAMEVFQNHLVTLLFIIGFVTSWRDKKFWIFYIILFSFSLLIVGHNIALLPTRTIDQLIYGIVTNQSIYNRDLQYFQPAGQLDQLRYYLFIFPMLSLFIVLGMQWLVKYVIKFLFGLKNNTNFKFRDILSKSIGIAATGYIFFLCYYSPYMNQIFSKQYSFESTPVLNKVAIEIRKHRQTFQDKILFDDFCDNTRGSIPSIFSVLSGTQWKYIRICEGGEAFVENYPSDFGGTNYKLSGAQYISSTELRTINPGREVIMRDFWIDYERSFQTTPYSDLKRVFELETNALAQEQIRFIITKQELLPRQDLQFINKIDEYHIYQVVHGDSSDTSLQTE